MAYSLDTHLLRTSSPAETARYLRASLLEESPEDITRRLVDAVEKGSFPPFIFGIWLGVSPPHAIRQGLEQSVSVEVRRLAIKQLQKRLTSVRWLQTWQHLGGTEGLLHLMGDLSVVEIRLMCNMLGRSAKGAEAAEKRQMFTELLKSLLSRLFNTAPHQNPDKRPLANFYQHLVPACSADLISDMAEKKLQGDWSHVPQNILLQYHSETLRNYAMQYLVGKYQEGREWFSALSKRWPSTATTEKGFSESMKFSFDVLQHLVKDERATISDRVFVTELVEPLLRRALRKRVEWPRIQEIIQLTLQYQKLHPGVAKEIQWRQGGLVYLVVRCWSRKVDIFEDSLRTLLSCSDVGHKNIDIGRFEVFLGGIPKPRRYPLLRLSIEAVVKLDIDVESDLKQVTGMLPASLLAKLDKKDSWSLFTRLRSARGDQNLVGVGPYDSILGHSSIEHGMAGDPDLFQVVLLQQNGYQHKAEELATGFLEKEKKNSMSSPDQSERASYAKSAVGYAIASGSLAIYGETLKWMRRFVRDPLTARELYQEHPVEAVPLLSGLPSVIDKSSSTTLLRNNVIEANRILLELFKTVCSALREPSFVVYHWDGTLQLYYEVVRLRKQWAADLKCTLGISDEQTYEIVWEETLTMILEVEKEALKSGHEPLLAHTLRGILGYRNVASLPLKDEEPATYRFFDNLARGRDALWRTHRPTVYPGAATLPNPFPRGLPIQHLTAPWFFDVPSLNEVAPYLASRVNAALFLDPSTALSLVPQDEETREAVGEFVDDYFFALSQFGAPSLNEHEKEQRMKKAWDHVAGPLSSNRMSDKEALRYWGTGQDNHLSKLWPPYNFCEEEKHDKTWLAVPAVEDPAEVEEWNPIPSPDHEDQSRKLSDVTYIDLSKDMWHVGLSNPVIDSKVIDNERELVIPGHTSWWDGIWDEWQTGRARRNPAIREGQVLSAILLLDSRSSTTSRVLSTPFPSADDVRYPSVYLDEHFLTSVDPGEANALKVLEAHVRNVPATLLAQVTEHVFKTLGMADTTTSTFHQIESLAFKLIELLAKSDRPGLASPFAVQAIIQYPDASSWHRRLLSPGFLRRLPATHARTCFRAFADTIILKVEEQEMARKTRNEQEIASVPEDGSETRLPFVKVTTVKLLAQLLRDTQYVSEDYSISVLSELAQKATHVDIRQAVVNSLLSMLQESRPELNEKTFTALESIIPIAGNLRERRQILDPEWETAEQSLKLPEVDIRFSEQACPMLKALLDFLRAQPPKFLCKAEFTQRILLPIIKSLTKQTSKYVSIFLRKNGIDSEAQQELNIPPIPRSGEVLKALLGADAAHMPLSLVEGYASYLIFNASPLPPIRALNAKLSSDPAQKSQPDVQIWTNLYGSGTAVIDRGSHFSLTSLLDQPTAPNEGGITTKAVQEQFLKLFTAVLWNDTPRYSHLDRLIQELHPHAFNKAWLEHKKPIVEAMILYVDTLRTRDWERDPDRQPKVLPDTFPLKLWLLKYPSQHDDKADGAQDKDAQESKCKALADQLAKFTDQMAGSLYHRKFAQLKEAMEFVGDAEHRLLVALHLGDITKTRLSWLSLQDLLRVELAEFLLCDWSDVEDEALKERLDGLVETWQKSGSEEVRRLGYLASGTLS